MMLKMMEAAIIMLMTMIINYMVLIMLMMNMTTWRLKRRRSKTREMNRIPFILVRELLHLTELT